MAGKADFLESAILDHVLGGGNYTRAATVDIALYTAAPSDSGGGTEVTGGSYVRKSVTNNATNFPAAVAGAKATGADITFATPSASWGVIVAFAVFEGGTNNMLYWGLVTPNKTVNNGDPAPKFVAGDLTFSED